MEKQIYEVYILDENGETNGTHYYCTGCAPDTAYLNGYGACEGIICESCGTLLVEFRRQGALSYYHSTHRDVPVKVYRTLHQGGYI